MDNYNSLPIETQITEGIKSKLSDTGLMYRMFSRSKSSQSIEAKLSRNPDYGKTKKIQDLIGIRIVLYFPDDITTVHKIISDLYLENPEELSISNKSSDTFSAVRYNIVYQMDAEQIKLLRLGDKSTFIDKTFELQIRTIFSEGWHEVDHDLRYKSPQDWNGHTEESRMLNGVFASLETNEWTMVKVLEELAYKHYLDKELTAMFRQKLRLRISQDDISEELLNIFKKDNDLVKQFFRFDRSTLIVQMFKKGFYYPLTLDNIIYFMNIIKFNNLSILKVTPQMMIDDMK